jgi:large repetitive protein
LRPRLLWLNAIAILLFSSALNAQTPVPLRKIGELELQVQGISATVQPANPTIPKNTAAGVQIVVSTPTGILSSKDVASFLGGPVQVQGQLSGPGLTGTISLPFVDPNGGTVPVLDPLILPIPPLTDAGDYTLSNVRLVVNNRPAMDVSPAIIPVKVIDQILITSVETRALTLDEIKAAGVVLDSNDFLGFQFTIGLSLSSNVTSITFPVIFDRNGVPVPQPNLPPALPSRGDVNVPVPTIVPVLLNLVDSAGNPVPAPQLPDGSPAPAKIPSVLVIPGDVGFLKQFFSAQLFVANGAPGGTGLVVHDVTGKINLPTAPDGLAADAPLSLPDLHGSSQPQTKPVAGVGADGQPGTADDVNALNPGDQGEAEFTIRGEQEGFHAISFDIQGTLDGLVTGPVRVIGSAQGGVLVRNPFFDMTFGVPAVVRSGEQFKLFVTVKNISQAIANGVKVTLDAAQVSGAVLVGDPSQIINTLPGGSSATLTFQFQSQRTGQVVASYLHFDTTDGTTGELKFTMGVGERGIPLSPDTLVLPASVNNLPETVVEAAMRVLGEGWSIANAPPGTLPAGVIRTTKSVVTRKALALAEAGLRVQLGESYTAALRDLLSDFYGGQPIDPGFDQILRTTDAGLSFERAIGAVLAPSITSAGIQQFQLDLSNVLASGPDFLAFSFSNGNGPAPVTFTLSDGNGNLAQNLGAASGFTNNIPGFSQAPFGGSDASPVLGLLTAPVSFPYTLQFTANADGAVDLAVTLPSGDGNFVRGAIAGVPVTAGLKSRIVLNSANPGPLVLEQDTGSDGSYATKKNLSALTIIPAGPQFISADVIDGTLLPGASYLGVQTALLFDRPVDSASAKQNSNYQIPSNQVQQATAQLSGRIIVTNLQQPEGPYILSTVTVSGLSDLRGVTGRSLTLPLSATLLQNPGGVVSGRVLNADGTSVGGAVVTYSDYSPDNCVNNAPPVGIANIPVDASGRYQVRYVPLDPCGRAFRVTTRDPATADVRSATDFVRFAGERLNVDLALFGRGSVAGTVTDLSSNPVPGATVVVASGTDSQVGAQAITDGNGQYVVSGITVGPVIVQAGKGIGLGHSAGNILRTGTTATVNITLDSGATSVSGVLLENVNGQITPVPNWPVVYALQDNPLAPSIPVAVVNTDSAGNFVFNAVPEGRFIVSARLTTRDSGSASAQAVAGIPFQGANITVVINNQSFGTANGRVTLADGSPASGIIVSGPGTGGVLTKADGSYSLPGLPISAGSQIINAKTGDGLRSGTASVLISQPGQIVNGVNIALSGLGTARFTVLGPDGRPVSGQAVSLLQSTCPSACGCNPIKQTVQPDGSVTLSADPVLTDVNGVAVFANLPVGGVIAKAISASFDVAQGTATIPGDSQTGSGILRFAGTGTVTGLVVDPDSKPAFGADLLLTANVFDSDTCSLQPGNAQRVATDVTGSFKFTNVKAGHVGVTASQVFFPIKVGAQANLSSGQTLNLNLQLVDSISGVFSGTVFLPDGTTPAGAGVLVTANGALPDVTVATDSSGHFAFAKIFPQATYTVTVSDPVTGGVVQDHVVLVARQDLVHDFRLHGKGSVTVQVVDGSNNPVDNASVTLTESSYPNHQQEAAIQPSNQGSVTFDQVFEGPFSVTVSDNVGRGGRGSSVLPGPGASVPITVQLTSTGTVHGHFKMPDGSFIPFASVSLLASSRQIGQVTTDSNADPGAFSFTFVPAGPILIQAQDPVTARVGVAAGNISTDGQDLTLDVTAESLGTVQGLVTSNGVNQPGANVDIFSGSYHASTSSGPDGSYIVTGVPTGHIVVNASLSNGFLLGTNSGTLAGEGSQLALNVALRGSGAISGQVLQADKTPAPGALITISVGGSGGGTESVSADAAGNFSFAVVPEGIATLHASFGNLDQGQAVVDATAGATVNAPITLNGVGSITGHTVNAAGNPIAGHLVITGTGTFPYTFVIDTNINGAFSLPQVLAGNFSASLTVPSGNLTLAGSAFSTVLPNQPVDITVSLQPTGSVTGHVFRSDGTTPAAGANVTVLLTGGHSIVVQAQTDGGFNASGIPLGSFDLRINDPISTGQALIQGNSITTDGQNVDIPVIVLNDTPMSVLSIDPADGSTAVSPTQSVKIAFSNPLSAQSLPFIQFSSNKGGVGLVGSLSPDGKLATFTGTLPPSAQITVTVTIDVADTLGRHPLQPATSSFQTGPPGVASIVLSPVDSVVQVASNSIITVNFTEPLAATTSLATLIVLSGPGGPVAGTTTLISPLQAVFTPAAPLPANGSFTITINGAADIAGNVQTVPVTSTFATVDTIAPAVQLVSPLSGALLNSARPSISFSAADGLSGVNLLTATVSLDGQQVATGALSFSPVTNLTDGPHTVSASVADRVGNVGSASGSFTIDTQPPTAAVISGISDGQILKGIIPISVSATDSGSGVSSIELLVDGNSIVRVTSPFVVSLDTTNLTDGNHTLTARATDAAGNVGAQEPAVHVVVNNVSLTVSFSSPNQGSTFNNQFTVMAGADKAVQRIDFTFGGQTLSATTSPYTATFSVATLTDGPQTVTATAFDFAGDSASSNLVIVVDKTPPPAPNTNLIDAEPPLNGFSQVHGLVGSVEAFDSVQIANLTHPAQATASVAGDGTFSTNIAGGVDDILSLVAADAAGNHSAAVSIAIRQTSSLPPANGNTALNYAGNLIDRVGTTAGALAPDGSSDAVFTISLNVGDGVTRTLSRIDLSNGLVTHSNAGAPPIGISSDITSPFLNQADGSISLTITSGATLTLITPDNGFILAGNTYTATASFTDGSRFVGTFLFVAPDDRQLVPHSATITANPAVLISSSTGTSLSTITIMDIRDINGTLVPDGTNIALSVASGVSKNGFGDAIPSAGGTIVDGTAAANNQNFKVFTISGGMITATYSGRPVNPPALTGTTAVVQMLAADSGGNVLGTEVAATQDINLRAPADLAVVSTSPGSLYGDGGDHRSHVVVQVHDSLGNPVPDGTIVGVSAANQASLLPGCCFIASAGGSIIGGTPSASGAQYSIFTTTGGSFQFDYSDAGVTAGTDQTKQVVITVMSANSNNTVNTSLIGSGAITLVGASNVELASSMSSVPLVFPSIPVTVDIHHVHDARGNLVPDGSTILVSAANQATLIPGCCFVGSAGGSLVDGIVSPNNASFRYYNLVSNQAAATYTVDGASTVGPGSTAVANVQMAMGDPSGRSVDGHLLKLLALTLVPPSNAVGIAQPASLLGDGGIHSSTVTFKPVLDSFGNTLPDGSKIAVSAASSATLIPGCCFITSAGGQILSGTASPSGSQYLIHTVTGGAITVSYADQNVISTPGQIQIANVQLAEAKADGTVPTNANISTVAIKISGLTSATITASPNILFADGGDHRSTITISNLKDASGNLVPDGTPIGVSAANSATLIPGCCFIGSAGGVIVGGNPTSPASAFQVFPAENGQVVLQYSSEGQVVSTGQRTATIQVAAINAAGGVISNANVGSGSIQLLSPGSATVAVSPSDVFADGGAHTSAIAITNLKGADGTTPIPDGERVGISVANAATLIPGCCFIGSAGGQILSAGAAAGDGTPATNNSIFDLFTIAGGQILATYADAGIANGIGQTQTVNVQLAPAGADGSITSNAQFADAPLQLRGFGATTASGPTTLSKSGGSATITFSGIKDTAGHLVPDGTLVAVSAANAATLIPGCCFIGSVGGTIVDGSPSPSSATFKIFVVQNGSVTVTYSPTTAGIGTANIQMTGAKPDGSVINSVALSGGIWAINITN